MALDNLIDEIKALGNPEKLSDTTDLVNYYYSLEDLLCNHGYEEITTKILYVDDHGEATSVSIFNHKDTDKNKYRSIAVQTNVHPEYGTTSVEIPKWCDVVMKPDYVLREDVF